MASRFTCICSSGKLASLSSGSFLQNELLLLVSFYSVTTFQNLKMCMFQGEVSMGMLANSQACD